MPNYKYWNYKDTEEDLANIPANNHLTIELDDDNFYFVKTTTQIELYLFTISTGIEVQIDVDPSNSSGDNKSRDHKIQSVWHDKDNSIIWFIDCDNDGTADDFDVWKLDYSGSISSPSVTEIGTSTGADINSVYGYDIYVYSGNTYVLAVENRSGTQTAVLWDVDTDPFVEKLTQTSLSIVNNKVSFGVYRPTGTYYVWVYESDDEDPDPHQLYFLYGLADGSSGSLTRGNKLGGDNAFSLPSSRSLQGLALADNIMYFIGVSNDDSKNYLITFDFGVGGDGVVGDEYNISLMLERNVHGATVPFTLEKAFHVSEDKIYQLPSEYIGKLNFISNYNFDDNIIAITDHFIIDASGNIYEMIDMFAEGAFTHCFLHYWKKDFPRLDIEYRSTKLTVEQGMFLQIIGIFSTDGASTANSVVFEGKVMEFTQGRLQMAKVNNDGDEIDDAEPTGEYTVDTDGLISGIISDFLEYITEGTLSDGADLGTIELGGGKTRKYLDGCAGYDGYLWALRPQGELDYDDATVDTGVDLLFEPGEDDIDPIWDVEAFPGADPPNRIIVKGDIDFTDGEPYEGQWDNEEDQLKKGIITRTYNDPILNSDAKCQAKAEALGALIQEGYITIRCEFRKPAVGVLYPHQTITFKYISQDVNIPQAQFIVDGIGLDMLRDRCMLQISEGVIQ